VGGNVLRTESCTMIRPQSLKVGGLEGLGIDVKILLKLHANNFSGLLYPEARANAFLRNVGKFLPDYTASHLVAMKIPPACGKKLTDPPQHLHTPLLHAADKMEQGIRLLIIIINSFCQENTKIPQISFIKQTEVSLSHPDCRHFRFIERTSGRVC
jgi:hypothetical protein